LHWAADNTSATQPVTKEDSDPGGRVIGTTLSSLAAGQIVESWTDWDHVNTLQRLVSVPLDTQA
jgi:hypothetical protein